MVDFVEAQRERDGGERNDDGDARLMRLEQLLDLIPIFLRAHMHISTGPQMQPRACGDVQDSGIRSQRARRPGYRSVRERWKARLARASGAEFLSPCRP